MSVILISSKGNPEVFDDADAPLRLNMGWTSIEDYNEAQRLKKEAAYQAWLVNPDTVPERFEMLRTARDARLKATDYMLMPDYPISAAMLNAVKAYRASLRDLPAMQGAPWDGGGSLTPWPELP